MKNLLFVAVVNLLLLPTGPFAQSNQAPVATPTDVKPGSITCEEVFHDMARNTRLILQSLKIDRVMVVGHSMGGMLAARFATQYPDMVERLVLYNPIGLVDPRFDRLWDATDEGYKRTLAATYQTIRGALMRYVAHNPAAWTPQFETDARIRYSWTLGADFSRKASRTGSAGNPRSRAGFQGFALHRC